MYLLLFFSLQLTLETVDSVVYEETMLLKRARWSATLRVGRPIVDELLVLARCHTIDLNVSRRLQVVRSGLVQDSTWVLQYAQLVIQVALSAVDADFGVELKSGHHVARPV